MKKPKTRTNPIRLDEADRPLRLPVVAEWLGVSTKTVQRLIEAGHLRSIKLRGLRVIIQRDFEDYWKKMIQAPR